MDALTRVKKISEEVSKRQSRAKPVKAKAVQLPLWSDRRRGMPNALARCALFTASGKTEPRVDFKRAPIVALGGYEIAYNGEELRQDDQDVFLQLVHLARGQELGSAIRVTAHSVLVALGWGRSKDAYERLQRSVARLREGTVWVTFLKRGDDEAVVGEEGADELEFLPTELMGPDGKNRGFTGNLIQKLDWDGDRWMLALDSRMIVLFGDDGYTAINWEERLKLGPLAKWLHSFYFTHKEPLPYTVQKLHELCGSKTKLLKHFRSRLKGALDELVQVGFLVEWQIDPKADKVSVKRKHTPVLAAA